VSATPDFSIGGINKLMHPNLKPIHGSFVTLGALALSGVRRVPPGTGNVEQ
jgi:hypothetical protein